MSFSIHVKGISSKRSQNLDQGTSINLCNLTVFLQRREVVIHLFLHASVDRRLLTRQVEFVRRDRVAVSGRDQQVFDRAKMDSLLVMVERLLLRGRRALNLASCCALLLREFQVFRAELK